MAVMQITRKSIDYNNNSAQLELIDTSYETTTKLIHADEGGTLETVVTKDFVDEGILLDIKTKQEYIKSKYDEYKATIQAYSTKWSFGAVPALTAHTLVYNTLTNIDEDDPADDALKTVIIQNEMYFREARELIKEALWWLKSKHERRMREMFGRIIADTYKVGDVIDDHRILAKSEIAGNGVVAVAVAVRDYLMTPVFSIFTGTSMLIYCELPNANPTNRIYITTDGSTPTPENYTHTTANPGGVTLNFALLADGTPITVKARVGRNGQVVSCNYVKGTANNNRTPIPRRIDDNMPTARPTDEFCYFRTEARNGIGGGGGAAAGNIKYTLDGTKPTTASATLTTTRTGEITISKDIEFFHPIKLSIVVDDTQDTPVIVIPPCGGASTQQDPDTGTIAGERLYIELWNLNDLGSDSGAEYTLTTNVTSANDATIPASKIEKLELSKDGRFLKVKLETETEKLIDISDFTSNPIYKPYNLLTLDDILRVYP
jgi:hypothetical protein